MPSVVVAQLGARRHYLVPAALHARGLLARFHTDLYLYSPALRNTARRVGRLGCGGLARLAARGGDKIPSDLVVAHTRLGLEYQWRSRRARTASERTAVWIWNGKRFCELVAKALPDGGDLVYAYTSAAKELFLRARQVGMTTCLDHATAPRVEEMRLVAEEAERFPGWALPGATDDCADEYQRRQDEELALGDIVVCASSFARNAIVRRGADVEKIRVVPLGFDPGREGLPEEKGRTGGPLQVLFVGGEGLRKGVGYLSRAVGALRSRAVEVRVAGNLEISEQGLRELRKSLDLLGPVPRRDMAQLFSWAHVLVLPSISDTFGLVILEAMAAGLPVITTPHTCGPDVVRESVDGFVVPVRDSEAIAERLDRLAGDRALLARMSRAARERSREYTSERYAERLVCAILAGRKA